MAGHPGSLLGADQRLGGREGFYAANYRLEYDIDEQAVRTIEMQPGEVLIFSERTIHSSGPNTTESPRVAFNYRVIPPDVGAYPNLDRAHRAVHMAETYNLAKWRAVVLRGEDHAARNPSVPWHELRS